MTSNTYLENFDSKLECAQCGEELTVPAWSGQESADEVRHFWFCSKCGYMFESLDRIDAERTLPTELVDEFLPNLLVA